MTTPLTSFFKTPIDNCITTFFSSYPNYENLQYIIDDISIEGLNEETITFLLRQNNNQGILNIVPVDFNIENVLVQNNEVTFNILDIILARLEDTSIYLLQIWQYFNIKKIKYIFPEFNSQSIIIDVSMPSADLSAFLVKPFIQNINSFKVQFISDGNTPVANIKFVFRLLSVCDSDLFDILIFSLDKDEKFQITENEMEDKFNEWGWDDDQKGLYKEIITIEGLKVSNTPALTSIPQQVYSVYNIYPDFLQLNSLEELDSFDTQFNDLNPLKEHLGFVYEKENSIFFITILKEDKYTFDLIHVEGNTNVREYVERSDCQDYKVIINGPFYDHKTLAINENGIQIGFRKYRRPTHNDMPNELYKDEDMGKWFYGKEENEFSAKVIVDNAKLTSITKGKLQIDSLHESICSFDGIVFSYDKNLAESEQPCNPDSNIFSNYSKAPITGNFLNNIDNIPNNIGNISNNIGRPFFGILEKAGVKYIFTLTLKHPSNFKRDHWYEIYAVLKRLDPQIAVFTDGSDSVFLKYNGKYINVGFGKRGLLSGKDREMPCLIGIIEKSKL